MQGLFSPVITYWRAIPTSRESQGKVALVQKLEFLRDFDTCFNNGFRHVFDQQFLRDFDTNCFRHVFDQQFLRDFDTNLSSVLYKIL